MASIASLSSFSSLSLLPPLPSPSSFTPSLPFLRLKPLLPALTLTPTQTQTLTHCTSEDTDPSLSNDADADKDKDEDDLDFDFSDSSEVFDFDNPEPEHEVTAAYEELYGPAYSGESVFGNDIYVMDSKFNQDDEDLGVFEDDEDRPGEKTDDGYEERVVQVKRVTKVVKGGKNMSFRAVVVVGNMKGRVGVGMGKAREVADAIKKAATNGRRNIIELPLSKDDSFPHR